MRQHAPTSMIQEQPMLLIILGWYAIAGCVIFATSIFIADFVVPQHDWISDTISDLGAGRYEYIVDIGIYAFSASLLATAIAAAHFHMGGWRWSNGIIGLAIISLLVFLIGARNEYGDQDSDGFVIHSYLVYALGLLMVFVPWTMAKGANRVASGYAKALIIIAIVWAISAPIFYFLPTDIDGIYERYLGLIAFSMVFTLARLFIKGGGSLRQSRLA